MCACISPDVKPALFMPDEVLQSIHCIGPSLPGLLSVIGTHFLAAASSRLLKVRKRRTKQVMKMMTISPLHGSPSHAQCRSRNEMPCRNGCNAPNVLSGERYVLSGQTSSDEQPF